MLEGDAGMSIWGEGPLHQAARRGDLVALKAALASADPTQRDVGARDCLGFTALHVAATEAAGAVAPLLAAGAEVDAVEPYNRLTPLMLAVARGNQRVVAELLPAGANPNAEATPEALFRMVSFADRGRDRGVLERLVAAGLVVKSNEGSAYFRLVLELTGHGVRYAERGSCRGIAGDTDDVWLVDRPMTVPAALLAPLGAANPQFATPDGLLGRTWFNPTYAATFRTDPGRFATTTDLEPPGQRPQPVLELAHAVRCGRIAATSPVLGSWSALAFAATHEQWPIVFAMLRSLGFDLDILARESESEARERAADRGLYPVHVGPLREHLSRAGRASGTCDPFKD